MSAGVDLAIEHRDEFWWSPAMSAVRALAQTGRPFTVEHVRGLGVPDPSYGTAWGALLAAAYRSGLTYPAGAVIGADGRPRRAWVGRLPDVPNLR